jgi:hypothetical protein
MERGIEAIRRLGEPPALSAGFELVLDVALSNPLASDKYLHLGGLEAVKSDLLPPTRRVARSAPQEFLPRRR